MYSSRKLPTHLPVQAEEESESSKKEFSILVPVFLKLRIKASDDLEAEVIASELIEASGELNLPGTLTSKIESPIRISII